MLYPQGANTHLLLKKQKIIVQQAQSTNWELVKDSREVAGTLRTLFLTLASLYPEGGSKVCLRLGGDIRDPIDSINS